MYVEIEKNQFNLFQVFVEQVGPKKKHQSFNWCFSPVNSELWNSIYT